MANLLNSLFPAMSQPVQPQNNLVNVIQMLKSGNPEQIAMNLMQRNPNFKAFVDANRGKSPEQVAKEHGVDLSQFKNMF